MLWHTLTQKHARLHCRQSLFLECATKGDMKNWVAGLSKLLVVFKTQKDLL